MHPNVINGKGAAPATCASESHRKKYASWQNISRLGEMNTEGFEISLKLLPSIVLKM